MLNPTLTHLADTIGLGAAVGGAGTVNRAVARKVTEVTGGDPSGLREKVTEFAVPAAVIGIATLANPVTGIGIAVGRFAAVSGTMALVEASAGAVKGAMSLVGFHNNDV